ncbi:MAG: competence protein ComEC, partial [Mycobacterium sp.]|nr:competence protein ComEC [Mycobacterium sp.]
RAAAVPGAVVITPSGWPGFVIVATGGIATVVLCQWKWGRLVVGAAALCLVAWSVAGHLAGHPSDPVGAA